MAARKKAQAPAKDNTRTGGDELAKLVAQQATDRRNGTSVRTIGAELHDDDTSNVVGISRRHDANYQPANTTVLSDGYVVTHEHVDNSRLTAVDRRALATVLSFYGSIVLEELEYHEGERRHDDLVRRDKVEKAAVRFAKKHETWPYHILTKAQVYNTYEAITGCKPGEEWKKVLAGELRGQAALRETDRIRQSRGQSTDPGDESYRTALNASNAKFGVREFSPTVFRAVRSMLPNVKSPAQILESVKRNCGSIVPPWLTVQVIETTLEQVNLGGKGGRGKSGRTPEGSVEYISKLHTKHAKPKK